MRPPTTLVLVLHGHLPDVLGHGTWPHGANWLYEAAAETYLPFLRVAERLLDRGIPLKATVGMTPVLCEQLTDARFGPGFDAYLAQRAVAARADEERPSDVGRATRRPSRRTLLGEVLRGGAGGLSRAPAAFFPPSESSPTAAPSR
jgi:1,4-alpha-glucan branching enzyme